MVDPLLTLEGNFFPFVNECMRRLYKFVQHKMLLYVVFDGEPNPYKLEEDGRRQALRAKALVELRELKAKVGPDGVLPDEGLRAQMVKAARAAFRRSPELHAALQERLTRTRIPR